MSSHDSASTGGKKTANSTDGKTMLTALANAARRSLPSSRAAEKPCGARNRSARPCPCPCPRQLVVEEGRELARAVEGQVHLVRLEPGGMAPGVDHPVGHDDAPAVPAPRCAHRRGIGMAVAEDLPRGPQREPGTPAEDPQRLLDLPAAHRAVGA